MPCFCERIEVKLIIELQMITANLSIVVLISLLAAPMIYMIYICSSHSNPEEPTYLVSWLPTHMRRSHFDWF